MPEFSNLRRLGFRAALLSTLVFGTPGFAQDQSSGNRGRVVSATPASAKNTPAAPAAGTPKVAAMVNGQPISVADLATQCRLRFGDEILEDLVNKTVIMQACQAQNIVISEKDIEAEIARTASKFNLTTKMYLKLIEDERDITPEQYAADIIWPMLALRALAKDTIAVTPQEIDREFQGEFGPKVKVRMIACKDQAKIAQLQKQATEKPEMFKVLAKDHSEDPTSASVEGLLPPIRRFTGDEELENVAFALQPNEVSKILNAGEMYVILQCVQHIPPANPPQAQMQEIQTRIKTELEDRKLRESAEQVYLTLREKSSITTVHGKPELERQYPGVAAIVNQQAIQMDVYDNACVKRFGKKILDGEINRKLIEGALAKAQLQVTQPEIDQEIRRAAEYFGFVKTDGSADIPQLLQSIEQDDNMTPELYVRDVIWPTVALKKLTAGQVQVTEEDIQKGFDANYGPRAEVLAIVLSNQRTAQQVWEMARNNPSEQFFGELASQYSVEDSSRSNFGKVPPLRRGGGQPTLEKAAFDLQPGALSGIVEVNGRYVILKSQGFTKPVVSGLNQAIRAELFREIEEKKHRIAMDQCLNKLRDDAQIVDFSDLKKSRVSSQDLREAQQALEQQPK